MNALILIDWQVSKFGKPKKESTHHCCQIFPDKLLHNDIIVVFGVRVRQLFHLLS